MAHNGPIVYCQSQPRRRSGNLQEDSDDKERYGVWKDVLNY